MSIFLNYRSVLSMGLTTELQTEAVICCLCGPMILFTCFLCNWINIIPEHKLWFSDTGNYFLPEYLTVLVVVLSRSI